MDISVELVSTVLLGMLALSAPLVLPTVLFRVLVKDGFPLDSQEFRRDHRSFSLGWLGLFLLNLVLIFFVGNALMLDRLRAASMTFVLSLIAVLSGFLLIFVLRRTRWIGGQITRGSLNISSTFLSIIFIWVAVTWPYIIEWLWGLG